MHDTQQYDADGKPACSQASQCYVGQLPKQRPIWHSNVTSPLRSAEAAQLHIYHIKSSLVPG